jgi:hypothetical protein
MIIFGSWDRSTRRSYPVKHDLKIWFPISGAPCSLINALAEDSLVARLTWLPCAAADLCMWAPRPGDLGCVSEQERSLSFEISTNHFYYYFFYFLKQVHTCRRFICTVTNYFTAGKFVLSYIAPTEWRYAYVTALKFIISVTVSKVR